MKNGANPNIKNNDGYTSLYYALRKQALEIVYLLLEHGANPYVPYVIYNDIEVEWGRRYNTLKRHIYTLVKQACIAEKININSFLFWPYKICS